MTAAGQRMSFEDMTGRIFALDQVARTRPLTPAEQAERDNLDYRRSLRLMRLAGRIARTERKLDRLRAIAGERPAA